MFCPQDLLVIDLLPYLAPTPACRLQWWLCTSSPQLGGPLTHREQNTPLLLLMANCLNDEPSAFRSLTRGSCCPPAVQRVKRGCRDPLTVRGDSGWAVTQGGPCWSEVLAGTCRPVERRPLQSRIPGRTCDLLGSPGWSRLHLQDCIHGGVAQIAALCGELLLHSY